MASCIAPSRRRRCRGSSQRSRLPDGALCARADILGAKGALLRIVPRREVCAPPRRARLRNLRAKSLHRYARFRPVPQLPLWTHCKCGPHIVCAVSFGCLLAAAHAPAAESASSRARNFRGRGQLDARAREGAVPAERPYTDADDVHRGMHGTVQAAICVQRGHFHCEPREKITPVLALRKQSKRSAWWKGEKCGEQRLF